MGWWIWHLAFHTSSSSNGVQSVMSRFYGLGGGGRMATQVLHVKFPAQSVQKRITKGVKGLSFGLGT